MTAQTLKTDSHPGLDGIFAWVRRLIFTSSEEAAQPEETAEEARARSAFVQEMLARNPNAFSSDLDVQTMMQVYPGQF